jgi:gliding motility-associated-like protein
VTFCSNDPVNTHVQLYFAYSDIKPSDTLYIFDGPSTASPLIGAYNNNSNPALYLMPIDASIYNATGCLTVRFVSDGALQGTGWKASITCHHACQEIEAHLDLNITSPAPDTSYIAICPGTPITFAGYGTYSQNDFVYHQSDNLSTFTWYFGDGTSASGPVVTHTYAHAGGYTVTLYVVDQYGCESRNSIETRVIISGSPFVALTPPPNVCMNDTTSLLFSLQNDPNSTIGGEPYNEVISTTLGVNDTTFLPDGEGVSYTSSVIFNCFAPGQTLNNAWDILSICANMEHSFLGDLVIELICPNGQSITLKEFPGGGGTALGEPIELSPETSDPGVGYTYCWSPTPAFGTMVTESASYSTLPAGTYKPFQTFADLVGCPLNGEWTIKVTDDWAIDNGYIFSWELTLNPDIAPDHWEYTIPIDHMGWTSGSYIINSTPTAIDVHPTSMGQFEYTYTVVDVIGCSWDTSTVLTVVPIPVVDLGADVVLCAPITEKVLDAGNPGNTYLWSDGSVNQTLTVTVSGLYSVTVSNGLCDDVDTISVIFSQLSADIQTHNPICHGYSNGSASINVTTESQPCTYQWSHGPTSQNLTSLFTGEYSVTITNASSCSIVENIVINEPPAVVVSVTPSQYICIGGTVNLSSSITGGVAPYTYQWNSGQNSSAITVSPIQTTTYAVSVADANLCPGNVGESTVSLFDSLHIAVAVSANQICIGEPITLTGTYNGGNGGPYSLTLNNNEVITLPYTFYPSSSQTLELCIKDQCTSPPVCKHVTYEVHNLPQVQFQPDSTSGCEPHTVVFTSYGDATITSWLWNFGDNGSAGVSNVQNPQYVFNNDGIYDVSLTVVNAYGCKSNQTIEHLIQVFPKPTAAFIPNPNTVSIINPVIQFNNISELNATNHWSFDDGDSSLLVSPIHKFPEVGSYLVQLLVTSDKGCVDTAVYSVMIRDEFTVYVPNAITIDQDGKNEVFFINGTNISDKNFLLNIYDRWGEIIYQTNKFNPDNPAQYGWDGRAKGGDYVPVGTYTWLVHFIDMNGVSHEKTGSVTVIR